MIPEHVISDEIIKEIQSAALRNEYWLAYNTVNYFLGKTDVYFFKTKEEAQEFSDNNISEYDDFNIINFQSVADVLLQLTYGEFQNDILSLKNNDTMNEQNFDYIKENLKKTGFGETLYAELEKNMQSLQPEFALKYQTEINKREMGAMLYFRKSDTSDMYFFNRYEASTMQERSNQQIKQAFYMNKGYGVSLKEAYNLLNERAVYKELTNKEGERYKAWIKLDFSETDKHGNYKRLQFHDNYGFNLEKELANFPIKEMNNNDAKEMLMKSLEKGNLQIATFEKEGGSEKLYIEANPQARALNIYDDKMQIVQDKSLKKNFEHINGKEAKQELKQEEKKEAKQAHKQSLAHEKGDDLEKRPAKKKSQNKEMHR